MNRIKLAGHAILAAFLITSVPRQLKAEDVISTLNSIPTYPSFVPAIGTGLPGDFGQLITAPNLPTVVLNSFEFELGSAGTIPVSFLAAVYSFDPVNLKVIGLPLYASSIMSVAPIGVADDYQLFTFDVDNLSLTPGGSYLLLLSQDNLGNGTNYQLPVTPSQDGDIYPGGEIVEVDASTPFPNLSVDDTNPFIPPQDLAFSATFNLPEPSGVPLALLALPLLLIRLRRTNGEPMELGCRNLHGIKLSG
jgi:hypothetical protein